ncbi:Uncharacterized protein Adt_27328 [Abeliophyllum distichum]|uniref:Uncharacterized protein n=1 Tax=Abeliophyllum distichum TaxID=126358 RepID=A0ABD1RTF0_9LAMI
MEEMHQGVKLKNSPGIKTGSCKFDGGVGSDGGWRPDHRNRRLEMPVFEGLKLMDLQGGEIFRYQSDSERRKNESHYGMHGRRSTGVVPMEKEMPEVTELGRIEGEDARKISTMIRRVSGGEILGTPAKRISS